MSGITQEDRLDERKVCRRFFTSLLLYAITKEDPSVKNLDQLIPAVFKDCRNISEEVDKFKLPDTK